MATAVTPEGGAPQPHQQQRSRVTVAVRVKPVDRHPHHIDIGPNGEKVDEDEMCVFPHPESPAASIVLHPGSGGAVWGNQVFSFDFCHWSLGEDNSSLSPTSRPKNATQATIFQDLGSPVVRNTLRGFNCSIFAYGQTGSGKTFTMMGLTGEEEESREQRGLIPRISEALFEQTKGEDPEGKPISPQSQARFALTHHFVVSYIEIYMEKVHDLLKVEEASPAQPLRVREHPKQGVYVEGATSVGVSSFDEIKQLIDRGNRSRMVASTSMNSTSSRSHAIFTIQYVRRKKDVTTGGGVAELSSKLHLVDLAGSENASTAGTTGERLKEGSYINKSLLTLGMVIKALAERTAGGKGSSKQVVPYRDSVLTYLLKDSLGGNSRTTMVATIRPGVDFCEETLSTLRYADRAKSIVNHAVVNEDPMTRKMREMQDVIDKLSRELAFSQQREAERLVEITEMSQQLKLVMSGTGTIDWRERPASATGSFASTSSTPGLLSPFNAGATFPAPRKSPRVPPASPSRSPRPSSPAVSSRGASPSSRTVASPKAPAEPSLRKLAITLDRAQSQPPSEAPDSPSPFHLRQPSSFGFDDYGPMGSMDSFSTPDVIGREEEDDEDEDQERRQEQQQQQQQQHNHQAVLEGAMVTAVLPDSDQPDGAGGEDTSIKMVMLRWEGVPDGAKEEEEEEGRLGDGEERDVGAGEDLPDVGSGVEEEKQSVPPSPASSTGEREGSPPPSPRQKEASSKSDVSPPPPPLLAPQEEEEEPEKPKENADWPSRPESPSPRAGPQVVSPEQQPATTQGLGVDNTSATNLRNLEQASAGSPWVIPPTKIQGYLFIREGEASSAAVGKKNGGGGGGFQRRWCILRSTRLLWYTRPITRANVPDSICGGTCLVGATITPQARPVDGEPFCFTIQDAAKTKHWMIQASSEEEQKRWVLALQEASGSPEVDHYHEEGLPILGDLLDQCSLCLIA